MKPQAAGGTKGQKKGPSYFSKSLPYSLLHQLIGQYLDVQPIPSPKKYWEMYFGLLCVQLESWVLEEENKGYFFPTEDLSISAGSESMNTLMEV